ncbi:MAG: 6-carboxytetrahydropterin synthase [Bacteroidota bacterium]|nr:6-carboxytetrahydropterin synthase [Bacteroidota bacterium]
MTDSSMLTAVVRKAHFNAAHRLYNPNWSDEKNKAIFGLCTNPNWHGHNYDLEVRVVGRVDPETVYLIDLKLLNDCIKTHVTERLDHRNLNVEVEEFADLIPTVENISMVIYNRLRPHIDSSLDLYITLWETPRNRAEYPAR